MPRILYWIGQNLIHFCLAKYMQEQFDAEYSAIIDCTNKPKVFFQNQQIVNFKKTWFYHDHFDNLNSKPDLDYLAKFEKKFNITLSKLSHNERLFMEFNEFYNFSENEILCILERECKLFEEVLENPPDFVLMFTPFFHHEALFYNLCKFKNVKVLDIFQSRLPSRSVISLKDKLQKFNTFQNDDSFESFSDLRRYINNVAPKDNFGFQNQDFQNSKKNLVKAGLNFLLNSDYKLPQTHYTYFGRTKFKVLQNYSMNSLKVKRRKKFIDNNFIFKPTGEKFVLYPLQLDSESSLLINSPFHINQIEIIKNIAKSLPINYKLYVKEHPSAKYRNWRSIETYEKISSLPNVQLIHPEAEPNNFLEKASLIITINSTVALDALLWGTPSMVFANNSLDYQDWGYSIMSEIKKISTFENLSSSISKYIDSQVDLKAVTRFIKFLEETSFNSNLATLVGKIDTVFQYGGFLVDVDISENQMNDFLKENENLFSELVNAHVKEIKKEQLF